MNKKLTLFLILISIGLLYLFNIERVIQNKLSILKKSIQSTYVNSVVTISNFVDKYLNQLDYIEQLKNSNNQHLQYKLLNDVKENELKELTNSLNMVQSNTLPLSLEKVKVLSYYKLEDNSRVIIDKSDLNSSKIYALITFDGFSAGIVLHKNEISLAYLNQNSKCNYTVGIGDENVPGITSGFNEEGNLLVKYVPIWQTITIGDEVRTSSMDSVFPFGVKVGKVLSIHTDDNIQEVLVQPYAKTLGNRNYFLYKDNKTIPIKN